MVQTRKKAVVIKKKKWATIWSPDKRELGESYVETSQSLVGREIKVNMMNFLNDPRKRKYNISFIVTEVEGDNARTKVCRYETQPTSIRMMIKKGHDRVDDKFEVRTSDNKEIMFKPVYITLKNVPHSIATSLRKKGRELAKAEAKKVNADTFFSNLVSQRIHKELKKELGKIYPLKFIEVKKADLVINERKEQKKEAIVEEKAVAEVKEQAAAES